MMKHRYAWAVVVALVLVPLAMVVTGRLHRQHSLRDRPDVVDSDFTAVIKPTDDPLNFIIEVNKVSSNNDKEIGFLGLVVDVIPAASGNDLAHSISDVPGYAAVLDGFDQNQPSSDHLRGRIRLIRRGLRPGTYYLRPYVRINEVGKDALSGPYPDGGSVLVQAGNSVKIELKQPWEIQPLKDHADVVDPDFAATITPTKTPFVFLIEVKRTDAASDKTINSHHEVYADLDLVDQDGRVFQGDFQIRTFAEDISDELGPNDQQPYPSNREGRVRLITSNLPPGIYTVTPNVRIVEEGPGRLENPRAIAGSVKVIAANHISVKLE